ncbi:sensor histidine kinase [Oscillospiraceae bacterium MB08-C2-2]|nr:sensor histidine kinase [Oscillospiraceae bacterium MB08-C2-2]
MLELSLHIMDVAQNAVSAGATLLELSILAQSDASCLEISLADNGKGMQPQQAQMAQDPFYTTRTTRKVGLGLPLFKMACQQTGGHFSVESEPGRGTVVTAVFYTHHIDMLPLGDVDGVVRLLIACNPELDVVYCYREDDTELRLDTRQMREQLGDIPLNSPEVTLWIQEYLQEQRTVLFTTTNERE